MNLFLLPSGRLATLLNPHADIAVEAYEFKYADSEGGSVALRDPFTLSKCARVQSA